MKKKFLEFMKGKFGKKIPELLIDIKSGISLKKGDGRNLYSKNLSSENKEIILNLTSDIPNLKNSEIAEIIKTKEWAFDFPGWVGELDFKKNGSIKEIMVIGMEPHIEIVSTKSLTD